MSEYTPITDELRERIEQAEHIIPLSSDSKDTQVRINLAWLKEKLDAIDSIHAQLERENEDLHTKFVNVNRYAEHVERENESLKAELDRVLSEQDNGAILPLLDMNDEPIHIGDVMQMGNDPELREVVGFYDGGFLAWLNGRFVPCAANLYRHHEPDTWERIIEDAIGEGMARQRNNDSGNFCERANPMNNGDLVARCKALCERTKEDE